jgi:hypothetical protein
VPISFFTPYWENLFKRQRVWLVFERYQLRILAKEPNTMTTVFHDFPKTFQANAGICVVSWNVLRLFLSSEIYRPFTSFNHRASYVGNSERNLKHIHQLLRRYISFETERWYKLRNKQRINRMYWLGVQPGYISLHE